MGISGIGSDYSSYLSNYRVPSIPTVSVEEVKRQDEAPAAASAVQSTSSVETPAEAQRAPRRDAALEDISISFNRSDDYGYIGRDSDIHSLDVDTAISDMRKDSVLQQYQFFVGTNPGGALVNSADGIVIPKF